MISLLCSNYRLNISYDSKSAVSVDFFSFFEILKAIVTSIVMNK